jgi:hypothetical protein
MMGHGMSTVFPEKKIGGGVFLLTLRTVTAVMVVTRRYLAGTAATGIAKFQLGCAGFPVAGVAWVMPVCLATRAGVFGSTTVLLIE